MSLAEFSVVRWGSSHAQRSPHAVAYSRGPAEQRLLLVAVARHVVGPGRPRSSSRGPRSVIAGSLRAHPARVEADRCRNRSATFGGQRAATYLARLAPGGARAAGVDQQHAEVVAVAGDLGLDPVERQRDRLARRLAVVERHPHGGALLPAARTRAGDRRAGWLTFRGHRDRLGPFAGRGAWAGAGHVPSRRTRRALHGRSRPPRPRLAARRRPARDQPDATSVVMTAA